MEGTGHHFAETEGGFWQCDTCLVGCPKSAARAWLEGELAAGRVCQGNPFLVGRHPRGEYLTGEVRVGGWVLGNFHVLTRYRGIIMCHRCGGTATVLPRLLAEDCRGYKTIVTKRALAHLHEEPPRLPWGIVRWPEPEPANGH